MITNILYKFYYFCIYMETSGAYIRVCMYIYTPTVIHWYWAKLKIKFKKKHHSFPIKFHWLFTDFELNWKLRYKKITANFSFVILSYKCAPLLCSKTLYSLWFLCCWLFRLCVGPGTSVWKYIIQHVYHERWVLLSHTFAFSSVCTTFQ